MSGTANQQPLADTVRLTDQAALALIAELELRAISQGGNCRRAEERRRYRVPHGLYFQVHESDSSVQEYRVRPRNISAGGIAVLHGTFTYPGTTCKIGLKALTGEEILLLCEVVQCRMVRGRVHEVCLKFDHRVDVDEFVGVEHPKPGKRQVAPHLPAPEPDYNGSEVSKCAHDLITLVRANASRERLRVAVRQLRSLLDES